VDIRKCESQWTNKRERKKDNILTETAITYGEEGRRKIGSP
jgi:hypothetical protein